MPAGRKAEDICGGDDKGLLLLSRLEGTTGLKADANGFTCKSSRCFPLHRHSRLLNMPRQERHCSCMSKGFTPVLLPMQATV